MYFDGINSTGTVLGIGIDLVDIRRLRRTLDRHGERFKMRLFRTGEQRFCDAKPDQAAAYARHYALKEACCKALGTGISRGVYWTDMELFRPEGRRPHVRLHGGAAARLRQMTPEGETAVIHASLTDEPPYAAAMVMICLTHHSGAPLTALPHN